MDVRLNEDQIEISRQARRFFDKECSMAYVRRMLDDERGFSDDLWRAMAEMGWMGLRFPEEFGGVGLNALDMAVLLEEMGRAVLPGPFFSTVLLAGEAIMAGGSYDQKKRYLPAIAAGDLKGTLALYEPDSGADPSYIQMRATPDRGGFRLDGTKLFVADGHVANFVAAAARTEPGDNPRRGLTLFLVDLPADGVSVVPLPTMDATRRLAAVEFKGLRVPLDAVLGEIGDGWRTLRPALQRGQVGMSAESVGAAQKAMEMAVDYAKIRIQFDQPIGAYQAIKHRCARMFEQVESARSLLYWAAWAQDQDEGDEAALSASAAKSYCSEVGRNVAGSAIQVLGGTGFSWEHDVHLYLKRAKANEVALGDPIYHREQIAAILGG
jgi:alkylation response protein AidB-like acyl-CoA dehydrogenase